MSFSESQLPREREEKEQRDLGVQALHQEGAVPKVSSQTSLDQGGRGEPGGNAKPPRHSQALCPADARRQATQQEQLQPEVKGGSGRSTNFPENKRRSGSGQDGGGVRRGDHLPSHRYVRSASTRGTAPTEHPLNAGRRRQTSPKARNSPRTWVGQKKE